MTTSIWWVRRDLRLHDNPALHAALHSGERLLPVFILDPVLLRQDAPKRKAFLFEGLHSLAHELNRRGSGLIIRSGEPAVALSQLAQETGAQNVFAHDDTSPYAHRRDEKVASVLPLHLSVGVTVHPPQMVRRADGGPYTVFTPFSKAWKALPMPSPISDLPERFPGLPVIRSEAVPHADPHEEPSRLFPAGEKEALRRLDVFLDEAVHSYADARNRLDLEGTSALSPYLRFGMLSPRLAAWRVMQAGLRSPHPAARRGCETWLNELIWREFYHAILAEFPYVLKQAFNPAYRGIAWCEAADELNAWRGGRTGYPVVDAAMRQLAETGWMHNRARMIVASFLTKDLHLIDGDPAANNGGWQWTAGVGTDAAPYFRIFNPVMQGQKFDPQGHYVRRWLPELEAVPDRYLHAPWNMPDEIQKQAGVQIGKSYPLPIVDHQAARERTLQAYRLAR